MDNQQFAPVVKVKSWILYVIISAIPVFGFITLLFWAFVDNESNPNRKNWAKAFIIIQIICVILIILTYFFLALTGFALYKINS